MLGHSKISTTADIYSHINQEIKRSAVGKLDNLLSDGTKMASKEGSGTLYECRNP